MIPVRLAVQQRVLPSYRVPFFDALAAACSGGLDLFAGQARRNEMIETGAPPQVARLMRANNLHILGGPLYLCWQLGLLRWLEKTQPDVLVMEANPRYLSAPFALRWMHTRGRPVIGWGLGAPPSTGQFSGLRAANRGSFVRHFAALITYSRKGAEEYRQAGFASERIFVAPNAVTARPTHLPPDRPEGLSGGKATLLFVGRLQARKRIDLLLRACAALPEALAPRVIIVGDGPELSNLQELARQVYPAAEFTGAKYGAELIPYFMVADLFVLPGTGGLAVQQAMSYGLPVMVAEADGTQVDLVRPENGWQIPSGDQAALTAALANALQDAPRLRAMGLASYRIVSEEINLENMVSAFADAVQSVV